MSKDRTAPEATRKNSPDPKSSLSTPNQGSIPALLQRLEIKPATLRPADVQQLQRTIGNRATEKMLQTKLKLGPAGDVHEQEADRVARQVVRASRRPPVRSEDVQRKEQDDDLLQGKPLAAEIGLVRRTFVTPPQDFLKIVSRGEKTGAIQAAPDHGLAGGDVDTGVADSIESARGGGQPLHETVRSSMEQGFGADFGGVRVHTGNHADALNRSLNARAFTTGSDIFFGKGQYNPGSTSGQELIAHELTHTVQQGAAGVQRVASKDDPTVIRRKPLTAANIISSLSSISFIKKKLKQELSLRRESDKDTGTGSMKTYVESVLAQFEGHFQAENDQTSNEAMMIAVVLENVARVIAVNELNDPALVPDLSIKLLELYRPEIEKKLKKVDNLQDTLGLATALIIDNPVGLYMHHELEKGEAARRIRNTASIGKKQPGDLFRLLRQKFEIEVATLSKDSVAKREDKEGAYNVKEATGEVSSQYYQELFGDVATPTWGTDINNHAQVALTTASRQRLDELGQEVTTPRMPTTNIDQQAGLTFKQSKHLSDISESEGQMDRLSLDTRVEAALVTLLKISPSDAAWLRGMIRDRLNSIPLTITVQGMDWFGSRVPDPGQGQTVYKSGASRRNETSYASLFDKKRATGSIKHLGEWIKPEHSQQDRGKNYNRFRHWKDSTMTGNLGFSDQELPSFAAVNANWNSYSSKGTGDQNYGVNAYGDTHFLLRRANVQNRCVYTATDHGFPRRDIYLAFTDLLLGGVGITRLKDVKQARVAQHIINSLTSNQPITSSTQPFEVQIFGTVDIANDVETIFVAPSVPDQAKANIRLFHQNTNVPVTFIATPPQVAETEGWFGGVKVGSTPTNAGKSFKQQVEEEINTNREEYLREYWEQRQTEDDI